MEEVLLTEEDTGGCEGSTSVVSPKGGKGAQSSARGRGRDQWPALAHTQLAHI